MPGRQRALRLTLPLAAQVYSLASQVCAEDITVDQSRSPLACYLTAWLDASPLMQMLQDLDFEVSAVPGCKCCTYTAME